MSETLLFIRQIIRIDILIGFGFYSIFYFLFRQFFKENKSLEDFDRSAIQVTIYVGIVWFALWLIGTISLYFELELDLERELLIEELTGKYALATWSQPIFWLLLSQLLRVKYISKYLVFRLLISTLFVVTIERIIIIITSFHRDYLPSDWSFGYNITINPYWSLIDWIFKVLIFIVLVLVYHFGIKKIINALQQRV